MIAGLVREGRGGSDAVSKLLSWKPINFSRWKALAWAMNDADAGAANDLAGTVPKLQLSWERLRKDLDDLFVPAGPPGTHSHEHFHAPLDPQDRADVLNACVVDYESALVFLDTALDASARGVGTAATLNVTSWSAFIKLVEHGAPLSKEAAEAALYLQRTVLYARNKAVTHPKGHIAEVTLDNVGNVTFWRLSEQPDLSRLPELDGLLHRVRPDMKVDAHVGQHIRPELALTWIGSRAGQLGSSDRKLFEELRAGLSFWLPGPYEIAPAVDRIVEALIGLLPGGARGRIALRGRQASNRAKDQPGADVAEPLGEPFGQRSAVQEAIQKGESGDLRAAEGDLRSVLQANPENVLGHLALAETMQKLTAYADAIRHYRIAMAIGLPYDDVRFGLAHCHFNIAAAAYNQHDFRAAAKHYREAYRHNIADGEAQGHLAIALALLGETDAALLEAERALAHHSDVAGVRLDAGLVLATVESYELALEQFDAAKALRPEWAEPEFHRAVCLHELDRDSEAEQALRRALACDPNHRGALENLADRLLLTGAKEEAQSLLARLLSIEPSHAWARTQLKATDGYGD